MKYIKWIGGTALLGATATALLVSTAMAGDWSYIRIEPEDPQLNVSQRICYAEFLDAEWPAITYADMRALHGVRDVVPPWGLVKRVRALSEETRSKALYDSDVEAGLVHRVISRDGETSVTYEVYTDWHSSSPLDPNQVSSAQWGKLATCNELTFPAADGELMSTLNVLRPFDGAGTSAQYYHHATATWAELVDMQIDCDDDDDATICYVSSVTGEVAE